MNCAPRAMKYGNRTIGMYREDRAEITVRQIWDMEVTYYMRNLVLKD